MSPFKPKKPCTYPLCKELTTGGRCDRHKRQASRKYDLERGNSGERGYDAVWQKVREMKASQDPLCEECLKNGRIVPLDKVHHIKPIETHPELRLVMENLRSLCITHHEQTHSQDRFGRNK